MQKFLDSEYGQKYAPQFKGLAPGTEEFNQVYKQISKTDESGFSNAQHKYIEKTHFTPVLKLAQKAGLDVENAGVKEALFSQSVQHGFKGNKDIISGVVSKVKDINTLPPEKQIEMLYIKDFLFDKNYKYIFYLQHTRIYYLS